MTKKAAILLATVAAASLTSACTTVKTNDQAIVHLQGTGDVLDYHPNGKVRRKANYVDGELVSEVRYFASGSEESNEQYHDGELQNATYFYASGRVKTRISSE